jgi:hypothetical protein
MLVRSSEIIKKVKATTQAKSEEPESRSLVTGSADFSFIDDKTLALTRAIGKLEAGKTIHYYSYGNFNLVRLMLYLLKQTGPAHAFMTSYSFSQKSIEALKNRMDKKQLLSFRVLIDNRVKTMSPKPFQMLAECFDYRCSSIHAKVALLWNEHWNLSIVTSQNATDNPKLERGIIFTDKQVFQYDLNALENEFKRGTT